jgi:CheY-like chemotaxis protein
MKTRSRARVTAPARRTIIVPSPERAPRRRGCLSLVTARPRPLPRVLVVDDDPDARLLVGAMIESYCEAQVTLAASVDEAMESVRRVIPDLVVTDAQMPGQTGLDLIRRLREVPRAARVPVVVATATPEPALHASLTAAGALAILSKPASPEDIARTIGAALESGAG